ncbi:MAG: biopolymer transporter ExbD [Myxococcota bacterium]
MSNTEEEDDRPYSMAQVKSVVRRKIRKQPEHEEHFLNIYPMMDMMVILLVFLIMQFASSSASAIVESDELRIPYSTSEAQLDEALSVQISRNRIVVDGDEVLTLRSGRVDSSDKQGGGNGFLITPLYRKAQAVADLKKQIAQQNPSRPFRGEIQLIADERTPFRTLAEIIYSLGQCGFKDLRFVVRGTGS